MRKSILFAALACCLVACQTRLEEEFSGVTSIYATMGDGTTKTVLSPGQDGVSSVLWSEADELAVFLDGKSQATPFKLSEGAGTKKAVFKGSGSGSKYVAFYPAKMVSSLSGDNVRITLPVEQQYQEGTFANGSFPMLASGNSPNLSFSNLASILRLSITGKSSVTRIVFKSAQSSIKVCGQATASVSGNKLTVTSNGRDSLVLTTPGVQLSETQASDFYLVLPPQTYKGGFTVRVYTGERYMDKTISTDFTMERSRMHVADAFVFTPNGYDVSTTLKGAGTDTDPFLIESLGDLFFMRDAVNAGAEINGVVAAEASYKLTDDMDLSPVCGEKMKKNWEPIGTNDQPFMGHFDGDGHEVKNLYIKTYDGPQGLFGFSRGGSFRNVSVQGFVSVNYHGGILIGKAWEKSSPFVKSVFENCISKGSVKGYNGLGGLAGYVSHAEFYYCLNEADVSGEGSLGGIVGESSFAGELQHCTNKGSIVATRTYCGGLVGYVNATKIFDGTNTGAIKGVNYVGGIGGYFWQGSKAFNCVNYADVEASGDYLGGIGGYLSCVASYYQGPATIANSFNLGEVINSGGQYVGKLAGYIGLNEGETASEDEPASNAWVKNSYWLIDGQNLPDVGGGTGIAEANIGLTEAQMKGEAYEGIIYTAKNGSEYNLFLDALNAGAYDWSKNKPVVGGDTRTQFPLSGWEYASPGSYPSQTDLDAQMPGEAQSVFKLSAASFEFLPVGGVFTVDVTSSQDYSVTAIPDWIETGSVQTPEKTPHIHTHSFTVKPNTLKEARKGVVEFTNQSGQVLKVTVKQTYAYLKIDVKEMMFSDQGGVRRFNITSSISWTVSSDVSWLSYEPSVGTGDSVVGVRAHANENDQARTATLTVSSEDGSITYTISLIQSGKKPDDGNDGDWKEYPFVHQSVAMRFTATWCGWCPMMNKSIKRAQELYPNRIQHIALHEANSDLRFNMVGGLENQFSIHSWPTGIIDGRTLVENGDVETTAQKIVTAVKETENTYGTASGVEIASATSDRTASISVGVYLKKAGDYKITVLLLEDGIINAQSDNVEGDHARYTHDCVARVAVTSVLGEDFSAASDFTVQRFNYSVSIPSEYNMTNMRVLVYIQRAFGTDRVIQSSSSYGKYFIDNCATVELGTNLRLALEGGSSSGGGGGEGSGDENEGITPGGDIDM